MPVEKPPVTFVEDLLLSESFLQAEDTDNWLRTQLKVHTRGQRKKNCTV